MIVLLNNTVLSNFSAIGRPDLVRLAFPSETIATVRAVLAEHERGIQSQRFPPADWAWLTIIIPTATEEREAQALRDHLGQGEADCLAVAKARKTRFATDDRDARRTA